MNVYLFFNELFFATIEAFIILIIASALVHNQELNSQNRKKNIVFIMFYTLFSFWATNYLPVGFHTLVILIFTVVNLSIVSSIRLVTSLIIVLIVVVFFMATEAIGLTIVSLLFHFNLSTVLNNQVIKFYFSLFIKIAQFGLTLIALKRKKSLFKIIQEDSNASTTSYILLAIFLLGIILLNINYIHETQSNILAYQVLIMLVFLFFIGLGVIVYKEKEMLWQIKQQYKLQQEYAKNIETTLNIIRREKHDFSNHINTIYALCILNKAGTTDRIKQYLERLIDNIKTNYRYFNTGNDYVDGLLTVKSNVAFSNEIHLDADFEAQLDLISINSYDLISIISNIIDNAFEAVSTIIEDQRIVSICTYVEEDIFHLSIANNGPIMTQDVMEKIFTNGFSTKKSNKDDHGLGLFICKKLIDKYKGKIIVNSSEVETEFIIKFPFKKNEERVLN